MDLDSWQKEAKVGRQQFVIHFVQTAQQLLTNKKVDLSIKQKILTFLSGAIGAGVALAIPSGSSFASEVFRAGKDGAEAGLSEYEKISKTNKKLELDHTLTALSSSHKDEEKLTKFRKLCIEMALEIFHAYDYQLRSVYRKISNSSVDRIQAIQMLGQYAGAQCFSQLSKVDVKGGVLEGEKIYEHLCKGDDGFFDKTKFSMDILKSMYKSWTIHKLYMQTPNSKKIPTKSTDARTFFKNPIPAFSSQYSCENLRTTEGVGVYVWFRSQEFCELLSAKKQNKFKMMRLRRPFKFEWAHWRQCSTGQIKIDAFENRDFFWADQSLATEMLYNQILPDLQIENQKLLTDIAQLNFEAVETINSHTSEQIEAAFQKYLPAAQQDQSNIIPPSSCSPPMVVPIFVGRENIIEKLQEILPFKNSSGGNPLDRIVVLAGQGGIGKTEASKKFALDWPGPKFFIKAESFDLLKSSFVGLAKKHNILDEITKKFQISETDVEDIAHEVYNHFSNLGGSLFIFDNAEQLKSTKESAFGIRPFLPLHQLDSSPAVLITSRLKVWGTVEKLKVIEVPYLEREDGHKFFCQAFNISEDQKDHLKKSLEKLVEWLGGLPLAMKLAAGYILASSISVMTTERLGEAIQEYLELFETDPQKLLDIEDESLVYSEQKVGTVWEKSWNKIANFPNKKVSDTSIQFLQWMSYLETEAIRAANLSILYQRIISKVPNKGNWACRLRDIEDALCLLERYSMISIEREPDGGISEYSHIGIHRLVQKWAQTKAEVDSKCLVDLANSIKNEDKFKQSRIKVHNALKRRGWPEDTFVVSKCWAIEDRTLFLDYGREKILLDVYAHLIENKVDDAIWTKLTAVRMNLVEMKYKGLDGVIDNKDLFDESDPLYDLNTNKICCWLFQPQTIDTLLQFLRKDDVSISINEIIRGIGRYRLVTELDRNTLDSLVTWFTKYSHLDDDDIGYYTLQEFFAHFCTVLDESHVENLLKILEMECNAYQPPGSWIIESMTILLAKAPQLEHRMMDCLDTVVRAWIASAVKQSHENTSCLPIACYGMQCLAEEKRWRPLLYSPRKNDQIGLVETFIQALPQILVKIKNAETILHCAYPPTLIDWARAFAEHPEMAVLLQSSATCMADLQKSLVFLQGYVTRLNKWLTGRLDRVSVEWRMKKLTELRRSLKKMCNSNQTVSAMMTDSE